jgi:predicted ATPase
VPRAVFVSHASKDATVARRVVELLEDAGVPCWIAPRDIPPGADYTQALLDGLAGAPALVLLFSAAANASPHVRRELETAVGSDTAFLPIRLEEVDPSPSLRYFIGTSQWLDTITARPEEWEPVMVAAMLRLVGAPAAPPPAPAPAAPQPGSAASRSLPPQTGTTVGRAALVADVVDRLSRDRLVTLTGPGGIGKTRVAIEVSHSLPEVALVDAADAARVDRALAASPTARVLATSRTPLGLAGEHVVHVPPLDEAAAVQLFREAAQRSSATVPPDAAQVAELCRLLGGVPLGLELAAGRLRVVGLDRLRTGVAASLDLVAGLREALDATLDGVDAPARQLAERLAVFESPATLEALEAVAGELDVFDALDALVGSGLVTVDDSAPDLRYALLPPVRLLSRERLEHGPDIGPVREAAAAHLLGRTGGWTARLDTAEGPAVLAEFATAVRDVEAAVDAALLDGRTATAVDLTLAAGPLWTASGRLTDALARARRVLDQVEPGSPEATRLHATLGRFAYHLNDWPTATHELRAALDLAEEVGDATTAAGARCYLAGVLLMSGRTDEGAELATRASAESEALDLYPQSAEALSMVAIAHAIAGELEQERRTHEHRLDVVRRHGDLARTADALTTLAEIALDEDDATKAHRYATESLALAADQLPLERRDATITLARAAAALGRHDEAAHLLGDALAVSGEIGQSLATAQCLRVGAVLAESGGDPALAVRLFASAQALAPSPSGSDEPIERDLAAAYDQARAALDQQAFGHEWTLGGAFPLTTMLGQLDQAVATRPGGDDEHARQHTEGAL